MPRTAVKKGKLPQRRACAEPPWAAQMREVARAIPGYDSFRCAPDGCAFDTGVAKLAVDFFLRRLRHVKGELARKPFELLSWQQAIITNIFGWKLRATGMRRYREAFIYLPRKNGKTTMAAGIILVVACMDGEPGAELYSAAADRDQAALVWQQVEGMVAQDPSLSQHFKILKSFKTIEGDNGCYYRAISSEANTKHGYNTHCAVIDELHAHQNRELVDVLITSTGARRQPLIVHITTADYDRESICNEKYDYACKVRDGLIDDPAFLPVIYEAAPGDDWRDEAIWAKANPNFGISVSIEYLRRECKRAVETPSYENTFRRLNLNQRTQQDKRWLQMDRWDASSGLSPGQTAGDWLASAMVRLRGKRCFGGLDLSSIRDLTAFSLAFPQPGGCWDVLCWLWVPEKRMRNREERDNVPYETWAKQDWIEKTPGDVIDYQYVRRRIVELGKQFDIDQIGYDPYNATETAQRLQDEDGFKLVQFRQGYLSMSAPSKEFERLVMSAQVHHGGHPVLRWMAGNVGVTTDPAGNIKPVKGEDKDPNRIDGIVAAIMSLGIGMVQPAKKISVYSKRGVVWA